jgi:hypothetical protein
MKGAFIMTSLAQTPSALTAQPRRNRWVGWSAIASGLALIMVGEKPYFPPSWSLVLLLTTLVLYLGMIPVARWIASGLAACDSGERGRGIRAAEIAEMLGVTGAVVTAATALVALPRLLPTVPTQILDTSSLGVIGLWLLVANELALRVRLYNRALAVLGVLAGLAWLLAALIMWVDLLSGTQGNLVATLESVRTLAGYVGSAFYLIWALWLGTWLLTRKR